MKSFLEYYGTKEKASSLLAALVKLRKSSEKFVPTIAYEYGLKPEELAKAYSSQRVFDIREAELFVYWWKNYHLANSTVGFDEYLDWVTQQHN